MTIRVGQLFKMKTLGGNSQNLVPEQLMDDLKMVFMLHNIPAFVLTMVATQPNPGNERGRYVSLTTTAGSSDENLSGVVNSVVEMVEKAFDEGIVSE